MTRFKRFTYADRCRMEDLLREGTPILSIAQLLGFHRSAVYREFQRGCAPGSNRYRADLAQDVAFLSPRQRQGQLALAQDPALLKYLSECLYQRKMDPEEIIRRIDEGETPFPRGCLSLDTLQIAMARRILPGAKGRSVRDAAIVSDGHIVLPPRLEKELNLKDGESLAMEYDRKHKSIILTRA